MSDEPDRIRKLLGELLDRLSRVRNGKHKNECQNESNVKLYIVVL